MSSASLRGPDMAELHESVIRLRQADGKIVVADEAVRPIRDLRPGPVSDAGHGPLQ